MKKTISMSGINGTFEGTIVIDFNYRTETKTVEVRVLHDEVEKIFSYHMVRAIVKGEWIYQSADFQNENLVWQYIEEAEKKVNAKLHLLANVPKVLSLTEQLKEKGFI